ncbi:MAG: hypothetical protein LBT14_07795 [Treponema sp.]|nr:hypothetical protein [Treponema sp.]
MVRVGGTAVLVTPKGGNKNFTIRGGKQGDGVLAYRSCWISLVDYRTTVGAQLYPSTQSRTKP